ncbi:MAG: MMPL family transporter [Bacteroidales bacterium]|nr:MMPL family transporter [Bacteroidales bacterium]
MEKIYNFFQNHKWLLWTLFGVTFALFVLLGSQCRLEENIFKLLPKTDTQSTESLVFTNLRLKDKIMLQVVSADSLSPASLEVMAEAMDHFVSLTLSQDSATHTVLNTLSDIDPMLLLDAGNYLMEHGVAYTSFTDSEMDSLTSVEHIREQVATYNSLLDTELGENLYDLMTYDPCGISMRHLPVSLLSLDENNPAGRFQYNHLYAGNGQACIGFITPSFGTDDSQTAAKLVRYMEHAREEVLKEYPSVDILFHGTIVLAGYNSMRIRYDLMLTLGIALSIIILLLAICLRQPRYLLLLLVPLVYGAFFSLATIYLVRGWMSLMALGLGVIVLGVALSYCLHVVIHYIYTGDVRQTVREQSNPVFLGALTTIGAFAGLLFTKSSLLQDFGIFALLAVAGTTLISLLVMPYCFPRQNKPNQKAFRLLEKINSYNIDRNYYVCAVVWIFVVVCICFSGKYTFDSNLRHIGYIAPSTQQAIDSWNRLQNNGHTAQYYASVAPSLEQALEKLPAIEQVADSLAQAGVIDKPAKMSALFPSLQTQSERIAHWQNYFSPERQRSVWHNIQTACQLEGLDPEMFAPFQALMANPAEPELVAETGLLPEQFLGNFYEQTADEVLVYFPLRYTTADTRHINDVMTAGDGCMVLDPYYYSTNLVELIHADFDKIMLISSLFVLILLLFTYRNLWIALIAFLPMALSWYAVLGAMALFHQPFNLINIVVSSFVFGIGVDYSIFVMEGLISGEKSKTMVYHRTAITISAFILVLCMFSLFFAKHPALYSISFASVVGMITTLLLTYTLQPNLYRLYQHIRNKKKLTKHT